MAHLTTNPLQTLPVANLFPQETQQSPICISHGMEWFFDDANTVHDIGGRVPSRRWHIKTPIGDHLSFGSNITKRMSRLDVFLLMFPPNQLDVMCRETNIILDFYHKPKTTKCELLKFFGIIILATRYEFQSRRNLWSEKPTSKYLSSPAFGSKTGMSRKRFDVLWSGVRWS
jgi:Transposase IS4